MAISVLMVYEPVESTREKENYWRSYISFYEKFWDGTATPQSSWYGREYEEFREFLSKELGLKKSEIEDCFFMKDEEGRYYLAPVGAKVNLNIFSAENFVPLEWFLMYEGEEKKYFYTHSGFGAIHHDAVYYNTRVEKALGRLDGAVKEIEKSLELSQNESGMLHDTLRDIREGALNLRNWLGGFDPRGFVLLNYGEICSHIEPDSLKNEDSVSELKAILRLAAEGDNEGARSSLTMLLSKWEEINRAATGVRTEASSTLQ